VRVSLRAATRPSSRPGRGGTRQRRQRRSEGSSNAATATRVALAGTLGGGGGTLSFIGHAARPSARPLGGGAERGRRPHPPRRSTVAARTLACRAARHGGAGSSDPPDPQDHPRHRPRSSTWTSSPTPAIATRWPRWSARRATLRAGGRLRRRGAPARLREHRPDGVIHLAAESHVDRSIDGPGEFVQTNVVGTSTLLQEALRHWRELPASRPRSASTTSRPTRCTGRSGDGRSPRPRRTPRTRRTPPARPRPTPRARVASHVRAAGGHDELLEQLRAVPVPEKLIPLVIQRALAGGRCRYTARARTCATGCTWTTTRTPCSRVPAGAPRRDVQRRRGERTAEHRRGARVCALVDELAPEPAGPRERLIAFVTDRPGHDARYAIDASKLLRSWGGGPARRSRAGCAGPWSGISPTSGGASGC
jgi:dTDP-glucose 4,6-dehydratase